jgi:hypothetical protein
VAVRKIEGVDSVAVSLNRGMVVIRLKPENRVTLECLREAIRGNGFTPKEAEVRARGTVVDDGGQLALAIPGIGVAFRLVADAQAPGIIAELERVPDQDITIEGRVPETRGPHEPSVLQARALSRSTRR